MERIGFPGVSVSTPEIDNLERSVTIAVDRITDRADEEDLLKKLSEITDMQKLLYYEKTVHAYLLRYLEKNHARLKLPESSVPPLEVLEELDEDLDWAAYLIERTIPRKRDKVIRLGFALKMGYKDLLELLMLCNKEPLSVRNAFDYICLSLLRSTQKDHYTWQDVQTLYARFLENRQDCPWETAQGTAADTQQLMDAAVKKTYTDPEAEKTALLAYMTTHAGCFYRFQQENRHGYGKTKLRKEFAQLHLSYTKTRAEGYLRLTEYLRILYGVNTREFADVFKACYRRMNWVRPEAYVMLEKHYQLPLSTPAHIRAVNRFYKAAESPVFFRQEDHRNVDFFTRNDALLMIFFLLQGFCQLQRKNSVFFPKADLLSIETSVKKLFQSKENLLDSHVEYAYDVIRRVYSDLLADFYADQKQREKILGYLMKAMDQLLRVCGYHGIYPLALMDRFCLISLVTPDLTGELPFYTKVLFLDMDGTCDSQAAHICMQAILRATKREVFPTAAAGLKAETDKRLYRAKRENLRNDLHEFLRDTYSDYQENQLSYFTGAERADVASISHISWIVCMEESVQTELKEVLEHYLKGLYPNDWKNRLNTQMEKCIVFSKKPERTYTYDKDSKKAPFASWIVHGSQKILDQLMTKGV